MKEEVTTAVTLNEPQSIYFSKLLCLPFFVDSVLVSIKYTFNKEIAGTYYEPHESASIDVDEICFEGYFAEKGELLEITNKQREHLQYCSDYIININEVEAICFEDHYEEENNHIIEQASRLYEENL